MSVMSAYLTWWLEPNQNMSCDCKTDILFVFYGIITVCTLQLQFAVNNYVFRQ